MTPPPHVIVLFGARGDLAQRKLLPGLLDLARRGLLADGLRVVGSGRNAPDGAWADEVREAVGDGDGVDAFLEGLSFVCADEDDGADLAAEVERVRAELGPGAQTLLYLSVPPSAMEGMVDMLGRTGLADGARIVMEKPFGHDGDSARQLDARLREHFDDGQIFRIDHFLGKEAAQDLLALRFANRLFEAVWHRDHVEAVFVDVPEELGIEGRGSFYEETGALRDMVVTHLAQTAGLVAMEPPDRLDADAVHASKRAAFDAVRELDVADVVFGQFDGYRDENDVADDSTTETFVAARLWVDSDRWRGVPFLLRTGKAMAATRATVSLLLRPASGDLFATRDAPGELRFELDDDDPQITLRVARKRPGPDLDLARTELGTGHDESPRRLDPYARLLLDALAGNQLLFTRASEVQRLWDVVGPVLEHPPAPEPYAQGGWGPTAALELAAPFGWRLHDDA